MKKKNLNIGYVSMHTLPKYMNSNSLILISFDLHLEICFIIIYNAAQVRMHSQCCHKGQYCGNKLEKSHLLLFPNWFNDMT